MTDTFDLKSLPKCSNVLWLQHVTWYLPMARVALIKAFLNSFVDIVDTHTHTLRHIALFPAPQSPSSPRREIKNQLWLSTFQMMIEKNANIHTQLFEMLKLEEFIYKTRETEVHNYSFVAMTL